MRASSDRRIAPRFRIGIPLHFHVAQFPEPECAAESLDVSSRGVCMKTDAPPGIGTILEVRMRLPEMIVGWRVPEWRITGHVVHVEMSSEPGKYGVGVQFHYYEAAAPQRGRSFGEVNAASLRLIVESGEDL